jgi:malonate decarboxylase epsilon subunit
VEWGLRTFEHESGNASNLGAEVSIGFLFPGQGSQAPGMLHELPQHPAISRTLDEVSEILACDVLQLDSANALQSTISVQLALLASGVAVARALEEEGIVAEAVAGLSVGAFGAAVHCGVITLTDSVQLVRQRAEGVLALYPESYGLAAIVGLTEEQVSQLIAAAHRGTAPVYLANINAPRQIVIAGSEDGMQSVLEAARQSGATRAERLPVSVPSHCPLLEPVAHALRQTFRMIELHPPRMIDIGNVQARALRTQNAIAEDLASNIVHPVRWHDTTIVLEELGCRTLLEMPPGHVLTDLAKKAMPQVKSIAISGTSFEYVKRVGHLPQL